MNAKSCPNCESPVVGKYCAGCGQRVTGVALSLRRILRDVLEDQFSLNSTFVRTVRILFLKPGFLTNEYFDLRIARYIPPFRLYLVSSLLFFLLLAIVTRAERLVVDPEVKASVDSALAVVRDSLTDSVALRGGASRANEPRVDAQADPTRRNWAESVELNTGSALLNRAVRARLLELGELPPEEALRRFLRSAIENVPKVMFVLLPIYALMLKFLYIRRKRLYVEHFIFALHLHAYVFLLLSLFVLLRAVPVIPTLISLWIPFYVLLAMKRVYGQKWIRTTLKWVALGWAYMFLLAFGAAATFVAAIFTA